MKRNFFAIIALVFFGSALIHAQAMQDSDMSGGIGDFRFGPKAGVHLSTFLGNDFVGISSKFGAYVGGVAEIPAFFENFYL